MFKSTRRPITIPQYEHGKLSGQLAAHWGNDQFPRPDLNFESFVDGVILHDWGYGPLDNTAIGEATHEQWLAIVTRGVELRFEDPVTDIVQKLHIRRLLSHENTQPRRQLIAQIDKIVDKRLPETPNTLEAFQEADEITRFCDSIAFNYSFEERGSFTTHIGEKQIIYTLHDTGVEITPWPFSGPAFSGMLIGYQLDGYPERLNPVVLHYLITPNEEKHG